MESAAVIESEQPDFQQWAETQLDRARSLYEQVLSLKIINRRVWIKYGEFEMDNGEMVKARNIWERATAIVPEFNKFWYKYTYMEEMLGNIADCRQVFERWMALPPDEPPWRSYIEFELRHKEVDKARSIYERFVNVHPKAKTWMAYALFEEKHGNITVSGEVYERALQCGNVYKPPGFYIAFINFEENRKQFDRARVIYEHALRTVPTDKAHQLLKNHTIFKSNFGDRRGIADVIDRQRRSQYEEKLKCNPYNYDKWLDFLHMLDSDVDSETMRVFFKRAVAYIPPIQEKRHWRRYIYLWINYALYEEQEVKDPVRTREVYQACLKTIPHRLFTFAKIWLFYAKFEIQQNNIEGAREALDAAISICPKNKLLKGYIELELQLGEFKRCLKLYRRYVEFSPENSKAWINFAKLAISLGDTQWAHEIFMAAIRQPRLDMPDVLWKSVVAFEKEQRRWVDLTSLYIHWIQRSNDVNVWISYARSHLRQYGDARLHRCRTIFAKANQSLRSHREDDRLVLLMAWLGFEEKSGTELSVRRVDELLPVKVVRRKRLRSEDGSEAGWEEYNQLNFPEDTAYRPEEPQPLA